MVAKAAHVGDLVAQIPMVWANLEIAVKASALADIVNTTTYCGVGAEAGAKIRPTRPEILPAKGKLTSTTGVVAGLVDPGFLV